MPVSPSSLSTDELIDSLAIALASLGAAMDRATIARIVALFLRSPSTNQFTDRCIELARLPIDLCGFIAGFLIGRVMAFCYTTRKCDVAIPRFEVI